MRRSAAGSPTDPAGMPPALMVHGLGGSALNWVDLMEEFAGEVDCHAVDLPGFGFSPPPRNADYSMPAMAGVLAEYCRYVFRDRPAHVFGNSLGGAVTLQLAARHPAAVQTLCLISPAMPEWRPRLTNVHLPVMTLPRVGGVLFDRYVRVDAARRVQATLDLCYADPARMSAERRAQSEAEARRRDALPYIREVFVESVRALLATYVDRGDDRPWKLAERITVPTLLVYGRRDKLVNSAAAHRAKRAFPGSTVVVLPDSGHLSQMEHPAWVAESWRRFVGLGDEHADTG